MRHWWMQKERVYRVHWSPSRSNISALAAPSYNVQANGCHMVWKWKSLITLLLPMVLVLPLWFLLLRLSLLSAFDTPTWPQMRFCLPFSVCFFAPSFSLSLPRSLVPFPIFPHTHTHTHTHGWKTLLCISLFAVYAHTHLLKDLGTG